MRAKLLAFSILTTLVAPLSGAQASWNPETSYEPGFHQIIVEDTVEFFRTFSYLNYYRDNQEYICDDMSRGDCKTLDAAWYNVILPVCETRTQLDCLIGVKISNGATSAQAEFERYTMPNHPSLFKGDGKRLPANPQSPSVWDVPEFPHGGGTKYVVHAGFAGGINGGKVTSQDFYAQIYAFEEVPGRGEQFDENNYSNFNWCNFDPQTRKIIGCGGGGNIDGETCVVQFQQGGSCGAKRDIPANQTITLDLRLSSEPNGWYHGRLGNPSLALAKSGKGVRISITGDPVEVPILYHAGFYQTLPAQLKQYWDECMGNWDCPKSTPQFGADLANQSGEERNVTSDQKAWTPRALETVNLFKSFVNDKTPKLEQVWAVRSLQNVGTGKCYSTRGFKGIVTTNATAYSDGPPTLTRGVLRYSVAAPAEFSNTGEKIVGSYDLIMRSSFAKCIYGNRVISPRAEISVTSLDGNYRVATSVTSRTSQWITVSAKNFGY